MRTDPLTKKALRAGRRQAERVLEVRAKSLKARARALRPSVTVRAVTEERRIPARLLGVVGGLATSGVLVAEGDSWFHYPWTDILTVLEDIHGYEVESVAHWGDRVEDMAYGGGQLDKFTRTLEKLLRRGVIPKGVLISGGGNDIAGEEFALLLNHAEGPVPGLNDGIVQGLIDQRIRFAYITILSAVTRICKQRLGTVIPILLHGYDYPVPDGRGFWGGWWILPGPWLEPGFRKKGYGIMSDRVILMRQLIDGFNEMLSKLVAIPEFAHVRYVNLRNTLPTDVKYKKWWADELHPTAEGFVSVAERFAAVLIQE